MAEGTYEYECMRAELLGVKPPTRAEFLERQQADAINDIRCEAENEAIDIANLEEAQAQGDGLQSTAGKLGELNHILAATQKKIDRFKFRCGSVTEFVKTKIGSIAGTTEGGVAASSPPPTSNNGTVTPNETPETEVASEAPPAAINDDVVNNATSQRKSDLCKALDNHVDQLDSMLEKAQRAELSMNDQNKQMRRYLK